MQLAATGGDQRQQPEEVILQGGAVEQVEDLPGADHQALRRWGKALAGVVVGDGTVEAAQVVPVGVVLQLVEETFGLLQAQAVLLEKCAPALAVGVEQAEQRAFVLQDEAAAAEALIDLAIDLEVR